ncbi:MAG: DUF971 domain-containing protein [Betaproteobacteria bacterium]|nr:DUF971 domain-containing protein [Betaproteobacteria bacterium]
MNEKAPAKVMPVSISLREASRLLEVQWDDASRSVVSYRELRRGCKCAFCEQTRRSGSAREFPADVTVTALAEYGPAAVRIVFSDGHFRGIFPFAYLRQLGEVAVLGHN